MKNDSLILIFILNNPSHSIPLWERLKKEYQYIMLDNMHDFSLSGHKKNDGVRCGGRRSF